jgi:hypothetical protein
MKYLLLRLAGWLYRLAEGAVTVPPEVVCVPSVWGPEVKLVASTITTSSPAGNTETWTYIHANDENISLTGALW